jgi:hypothetical protein
VAVLWEQEVVVLSETEASMLCEQEVVVLCEKEVAAVLCEQKEAGVLCKQKETAALCEQEAAAVWKQEVVALWEQKEVVVLWGQKEAAALCEQNEVAVVSPVTGHRSATGMGFLPGQEFRTWTRTLRRIRPKPVGIPVPVQYTIHSRRDRWHSWWWVIHSRRERWRSWWWRHLHKCMHEIESIIMVHFFKMNAYRLLLHPNRMRKNRSQSRRWCWRHLNEHINNHSCQKKKKITGCTRKAHPCCIQTGEARTTGGAGRAKGSSGTGGGGPSS